MYNIAYSTRDHTKYLFYLILFIYLFESDHSDSGSITHTIRTMNTHTHAHTYHKIRKTQKHTHYDEIVSYTDTEQLITCTRPFGQENSLLANVTFALCITIP